MALKKQKVGVTFAKGVDEKTATKLVVPGSMVTMENGIYNKVGEVSKRNGYDDLNVDVDRAWPSSYTAAAPFEGPITTGESAGVLEDELLLFDGNYVMSRSTVDGNWTYKDQATPVITRASRLGWGSTTELGSAFVPPFVRDTGNQDGVQMIVHNNFKVYVWDGGTYSVVDAVTGDRLVTTEIMNTGLGQVVSWRLVAMGQHIFLLRASQTGTIEAARMEANAAFDASNPWPSTFTVVTDAHPTNTYIDAVEIDAAEICLAYVRLNNQAATIRTMRLDNTATILASVETVEDCSRCLSVFKDPVSSRIGIAWCNTHTQVGTTVTQDVKFILWDAALTNVPANWAVYQPGPFGMLINRETGVDVEGTALHISLGQGIQDDYLSIIWDTATGVTLPASPWTAPYLPPKTHVKIRHVSSTIITNQANYDISTAAAMADGIVLQTSLATGPTNGDNFFTTPIMYATLASRQFKKGNYIYFAVVQPHTPVNRPPAPGDDEVRDAPPMTLDGNTDTSYGFMRMERCGVAYAEEPAPYTTQDQSVTQFGKQGTCSVVGKFSARISGGTHLHAQVSRITQEIGLDKFFFGGAEIALVPSEPGERPTDAFGQVIVEDSDPATMGAATDAIHMVTECLVDFSDLQNRYESKAKSQIRLTTGGVISCYDKTEFIEDSFVYPPELWEPAGAVSSTAASSVSRKFVAVFEWWDNRGQRRQSAPSVPFTNTWNPTPGLPSTTLRWNVYGWLPKDTRLVVYATESGTGTATGDTYYRIPRHSLTAADEDGLRAYMYRGSPALPSGATPGLVSLPSQFAFYSTSGAGLTDATLRVQEVLYTDGGVVENREPPSSTCIEDWDGRVWLGGLERNNEVAFSKSIRNNEAVNFADEFRIEVGSQLKRVVALQAMDDKLVVFKEDSIYVIYGDGPNDLGQGASYRAQLVTSDQGCSGPKGVVLTPTGVMFHNSTGIYRLSRGLKLDFVGARVEDSTQGAVVHGAELVPDKTQARFMMSGGNAVVYDYLTDAWYKFTNHTSTAGGCCVMWKGNFSFLNAGGAMKVQNALFLDDAAAGTGTYIPTTLETAWIKTADVEGLQRVYKLLIIGDAASGHDLTVEVGFDYDTAYTDSKTWTAAEIASLPRYQLEIRPSRQRCQAIRLRLSDTGTPPVQNKGYVMTYLMLEVGIQDGLYRRFAASVGRK